MDFKYTIKGEHICKMKLESVLLTKDQILVIEQWIRDDVISPESVLEELSSAMNSIEDFEPKCLGGNAFWMEIGKESTLITFQYEDNFEEGKCPLKPCKVPTKLLYEIVKVWAVEYKKWRTEYEEKKAKDPNFKPKIIGRLEDFLPKK